MILLHHLDSFNSTDTFNSRQVFVLVFLTVGGGWYPIYGSGTKLYVTDEQIVKPVVSVYPAASRAHLEGKSSLLCVASAMFPPLVRFSWKRQKDNVSFQCPSHCQVKLLCLMYTVLIVKSLVYCCGLSLLMILRNKGPSTSCTHAD